MKFPAITDLLPHAPPMLLIDRIVEFDEHGVVCEASPAGDCIFARDGEIPGIVALEYMAQTIGVYANLKRRMQANGRYERPPVGFIIGVRHLTLGVRVLEIGATLCAHARPNWLDGATANFECALHSRARQIASAHVTVHEPSKGRSGQAVGIECGLR